MLPASPGTKAGCKHLISGTSNNNTLHVKCTWCSSVILRPGSAQLITMPKSLPHLIVQRKSSDAGEWLAERRYDHFRRYWHVPDKFSFENVAFTRVVKDDGVKYLVCADCEAGPVGFQDLNTEESYIALERVDHS